MLSMLWDQELSRNSWVEESKDIGKLASVDVVSSSRTSAISLYSSSPSVLEKEKAIECTHKPR